MKTKLLFPAALMLIADMAHSQNVGIGTASPHSSAQLEIASPNKGLLIPRMGTSAITSVNSPSKGLLIYDSTLNQLMINAGTASAPDWQNVSGNSTGWKLSGNSGTDPAAHFIGTTDNKPIRFRVNNFNAGHIDSFNNNTYLGYRSGGGPLGYSNVAIGYKSLFSNTYGGANTAVGCLALSQNTEGTTNTASGYQALTQNISGSSNNAFGSYTLNRNTTGSYNTAIGSNAMTYNTTGNKNTAIGNFSLYINATGEDNTALGYTSLHLNNTGNFNTAAGSRSLHNNTSGSENSATGFLALYNNTTGNNNSASGARTLYQNTTGSENTAVGFGALENNTTATKNTAAGWHALRLNTTGYYNTAVGDAPLYNNITGIGNTAIGSGALYSTSSSSYNTMLGYHAGSAGNLGWNNTFIGAECNSINNGVYNSIGLGNGVVVNLSNIAVIGNTSMLSIGGHVGWSTISDGRFKKNINENVRGLDFIMKLRPVTYNLDVTSLRKKLNEPDNYLKESKMDIAIAAKESMVQSGFIAQEVEAAAKKLGYDFSGVDKPKSKDDLYSLRYAEFVVPLVKAVQEQQKIIEALKTRIESLEKISAERSR